MPKLDMQFKVNMDMKNFKNALLVLSNEIPVADQHKEKIVHLVRKEKLYEEAIRIFKEDPHFQVELKLLYADYLFKEAKNTKPAAFLYEACGAWEKAAQAYKVRLTASSLRK